MIRMGWLLAGLLVLARDGALDTSFNGSGRVLADVLGLGDYGQAIGVQSNGRILVAGYTSNGINTDIALTRHLADGSIDTSFGSGGKVVTDLFNSGEQALDIAIQTDGRILIAGYFDNGNDNGACVIRYTTEGDLDPSFGSNGLVTYDQPGFDEKGSGIAIQPDGKVIMVGSTTVNGTSDVLLVRFETDGSPDSTFGGNGTVVTDIEAMDDYGEKLALQDNLNIVVAATSRLSSGFAMVAMRFLPDGQLDTDFDGDGLAVAPFSSGSEQARGIAIQTDQKLILAGNTFNGTNFDLALARFSTNGATDNSFDGDGLVETDLAGQHDFLGNVVFQRGGRIIVCGWTQNGSDYNYALARYLSDGTLDGDFDGDGMTTTDFFGSPDYATALALQSDGRIVLAGRSGFTPDFSIARYKAPLAAFQALLDQWGNIQITVTHLIAAFFPQ